MISGKKHATNGTCAKRALIVGAMFAGVAVAISLARFTIGPELGFVLAFMLAMSGVLHTRIGRECLYILVNTIGVAGLNSSGRSGDDPYMGLYYFPWVILTIAATITLAVVVGARIVFRKEGKNGDWATRPEWPRPAIGPRWRLRTLIVCVALIGAVLGGVVSLYRRSQSFERLAAYHGQTCHQLYESLQPLPETSTTVELIRIMKSQRPKDVETLEAAFYHDLMEHKYAAAARQPWLPVPPDPPLSDWVRDNLPAQ